MEKIIDSNLINNNNKRIDENFSNLRKLFYDNKIFWYLAKNKNNEIVACAGCKNEKFNSLYINELFSFQSGYGSKLLLYILNFSTNYNIIFLNSDWSDKSRWIG